MSLMRKTEIQKPMAELGFKFSQVLKSQHLASKLVGAKSIPILRKILV